MRRKIPMKQQWLALLLTALLAMIPAALAEEEAESGFGTFLQPEGVELCAVEEAAGLAAPDGLEDMYALMQRCNPFASAYVFRMPEGRALMSVACTTTGSPKTALELLESWPQILNALQGEGKSLAVEDTYPRVETLYDRQTLHVQAVLETAGISLPVRLDGVAFYQGDDLIELWQVWPEATVYQLKPLALQELREDLSAMKELTDSFQFQSSEQGQEESL